MISTENISKKYGEAEVLNIEGLEIPKGQSFGLVGNNGAGKTTYFNLLLDLIKPTTGRVLINEIQVNKSEDWKPFTSAFIDESFLIGYLTAEEYFYFIGDLRGVSKEDVDEFLEQFKEIFNDEILGKKKYLRDLSKGNQKKAGIVAALIGNPEIIILDEPMSGLDPFGRKMVLDLILDLKEQGKTILFCSHILNDVERVCDRVAVMDKAELKGVFTQQEIKENDGMESLFLKVVKIFR